MDRDELKILKGIKDELHTLNTILKRGTLSVSIGTEETNDEEESIDE